VAGFGELCLWAALPLALRAATACLGAAWSGRRRRDLPWLPHALPEGYGQADAELDAGLLHAWSLAAGELPGSAGEGQAPTQGVER